jgi:RHS repeat-associated protein
VSSLFGRWYFQHSVYARNYGTAENPNWRWLGEWNDNDFVASSNSAINQTWQYIAMTYDGSLGSNNLKLYVNDSLEAQDNEANNNINETRAWQIGTHGANSYDWVGDVDEFRICSETLSADWIKFEYRNMAEADNELTWSAEEEAPESSEPSTLIGNPYMFTGRRFDLETGLYYYRARYYNPQIGRFLQTDPIGYSDGMNWYNYCANNSIGRIDPSGLWWAGDPYNDGIWMQDYASSCGPATIVNTLWNLFPKGKFDNGDPLPTEEDIRIMFEKIIKPNQKEYSGTDKKIWGEKYSKGCNYFLKGGQGVTMEEVLEVLNDILSANKTGKQYKMIKGGAWSLDDIDKGVESGPVIHCVALGDNAHVAMIPAKGECDGVEGYWHVSSVTTHTIWSPEDWIDEYLRNDFLYGGNMVNSYDVPILVPDW